MGKKRTWKDTPPENYKQGKVVDMHACPNCKTPFRGTGEIAVCAKCGYFNDDYMDLGNGLRNKMKALKKVNPELYKEIVKNEKRIRLGKKPLPSKFATSLQSKDEPLHTNEHPLQQEQ